MEIFDRTLGRSGREVLYRPIEFERYRKPHVVEYPRHAIVLNPHHTREQRDRLQNNANGDATDDGSRSEHASDDDSDAGDDDNDPWRAEKSTFLCSDAALRQCLHLRWQNVGAVGIGLQNMGNTCFANSVLQAIAYTPALAQYFANTFKTADTQLGAPHDFAHALGEVVRHVHLGRGQQRGERGASYRPTPIVGHLRALSKHFSIGKQSDAHEFAVQLLQACQRSILFRLVGSKKVSPAVAQTTALSRICGGYLRSQVAWSRRDEVQQLINAGKKQEAVDLKMAGQHQHRRGGERSVDTDRLVSNTYDPSVIINVEIAGNRLEHCLERFCQVEKLDGRCYLSPRDANVRATKQFRIHVPPNVLVIQLKRFTATGGKIGKHVQFPKVLDITPFCSEVAVARAAGAKYTYELNAVCVHEGSSLSYGHYYAAVRARNGAWYECNDSHVSTLSEDAVMRLPAYMLFYSRLPTKSSAVVKSSSAAAVAVPTASVRSSTAATFGNRLTRDRPSPRLTASPVALEMELGKALTDDEVAALIQRKKASAASHASEERSRQSEIDDSPRESQRRLTLKRARDELPTESENEDDDGAEVEEEEEETEAQYEAGVGESRKATGRPSESGQQLVKKGRYGGIIKAMTYHRTPVAAKGAGEPAKVYRVGRHAVSSIGHHVAEATPDSVRRPAEAPKFQQKMRDVLWEMEMDKGRVKKVKARREEAPHDTSAHNRFQHAGQGKFDIRGRPLHKGGAVP